MRPCPISLRSIFFSQRLFCILQFEQVNISLWPRFKMVFDSHISSLRDANVKTLWEDDVHPHYVMRRYAEFTASFIHLNVEYGDGQVCKYHSLFFYRYVLPRA